MKTSLSGGLFVAGALLAAPLHLWAQSEDGRVSAALAPAQTGTDTGGSDATKQEKGLEAGQSSAPALSAGIEEILRMVEAKVSPEVIKSYVENAAAVCNPTAADLVSLKAHGVPDDIATALMKRSAESRSQAFQSAAPAATPTASAPDEKPSAAVHPRVYALDPESYAYFQYYYLQPRTLASVYQRLSPYYPHSYGYNAPLPYGPHFSGGSSRHHRGGPRGSLW